jgi:hypothetical protein
MAGLQNCRIGGLQDCRKGGLQDCRKGGRKALRQSYSAASPLSVLSDSRCRAAFRENRSRLTAFIDQPRSLCRVTHLAVLAYFQPQFAFVGFFEDDAQLGGEFGVRASTACAAVVSSDAESGACELAGDGVARGCSWECVDEVENSAREPLRPDLEIFGGLVHARTRCRFRRPFDGALRFLAPFLLHFLQSSNPAILQFLRSCNFCDLSREKSGGAG